MSQQPDTIVDISEHALREAARKVHAVRPGVETHTALAVIQALLTMGWRPAPRRIDVQPCSCGDPHCHWNGADEVMAELGWYRPSHRPVPGAEPLSKPWRA